MGRALRAAVAGAGSIAALALFAPAPAMAHPCASANANVESGFLSVNNAMWAGMRPVEVGHDCSGEGGPVTAAMRTRGVTGDPLENAVNPSTFDWSSNMTPLGYSANVIPYLPAPYNSDLAFQGKYAYQGTNNGFIVIDIEDPRNPRQAHLNTSCTTSQGDVIVYKNILVRSWDSPVSANGATTQSCGGQLVGQGFEGIHIFDISDPENPKFVRGLRFSTQDMPRQGCGSHTATAVPDETRGNLYIYNGGSSGTCTWMDVLKIKMSDPTEATYVKQAPAGRACHDNTVFLNGANSRASCSGGNGITMFKFDATIDPTLPGGIENPIVMWNQPLGVGTGHSAAFSYDGKTVVFGHEPGGGVAAQCQTSSSVLNRSLFFLNTETGATISTLQHPRFQDATENCTWHNFNTVPTKGGNFLVSGNYQAGITVIDYTQPAAPKAIAFADPKPLPRTTTYGGDGYPDGGDWSTYWYNGKIYESDIYRGLMIWDLDNSFTKRANTVSYSNPQTQIGAIAPDNVAPTVTSTNEGAGYLRGSAQTAVFTCADVGLGVDTCTGPTTVDTSTVGRQTFTVTAVDKAGNTTNHAVNYMVNSIATQAPAGGAVAATLSLTMGAPAQFGVFVPGVAREYTATTTANVISTAGDATLSVADPSTTNTGRLVNGTFALPQPLQGLGVVKSYAAPVSNDQPVITFKQAIGAGDALRTGTYSKTLTFTLSTTAP
jgi:hypothetical protein